MRTLALVAPEMLDQDELNDLVEEAIESARRALLQPDGRPPQVGLASTPAAATSDSRGGPPLTDRQSAGRRVLGDSPALTNTPPTGQAPVREDSLLQELRARELEVVDLRERRGRLWVVGGREIESELMRFAPPDARFIFSPNGASSTGHRPAWYLFHRVHT